MTKWKNCCSELAKLIQGFFSVFNSLISLGKFYNLFRYWELVPDLDVARDRIKDLEHQLEEASRKLEEQEDKHKQLYLQMYSQGQEAARLEHENQVRDDDNYNVDFYFF